MTKAGTSVPQNKNVT